MNAKLFSKANKKSNLVCSYLIYLTAKVHWKSDNKPDVSSLPTNLSDELDGDHHR